ncbi:hypothetical protein COCOBI_07-6670 [Coccomyxa sp. Obi]|nr:hypothetical protein COCOBI_07-6670 [Coccomyxa sp. Obi]
MQAHAACIQPLWFAPCVIFWDIDNISVRRQDDIELICRKLQAHAALAVNKLKGESVAASDVYIVAYGNKETFSIFEDHIAILREMPDVLVRPVSSSRGSADQAIITDMMAVAENGAAVALVSCDRGFATALQYCRFLGCPTIWISLLNIPNRGPRKLRRPKDSLVIERALVSWRNKLPKRTADVALSWEQIMSGPLDIS